MNNNPDSVSPTMIRKNSTGKTFSCLGILAFLILISCVTAPVLCVFFIDSFFAKHAPKQADIDRANGVIRQINAKMDEFEESLRPLQEQIEAMEKRLPKIEKIDQMEQADEHEY